MIDLTPPPVTPALITPTASPIKCHGGKRYLAEAILAVMARHRRYDPVRRAWAFFVVNRQSRQALGQDWASVVRGRNRGGMYDHSSAWLSAVEGLPAAVRRLRRVAVLNRDALDVIRDEDTPETL